VINYLLDGYRQEARPVMNPNGTINVTFGMELVQLVHVVWLSLLYYYCEHHLKLCNNYLTEGCKYTTKTVKSTQNNRFFIMFRLSK